jgi:hypothetical protein
MELKVIFAKMSFKPFNIIAIDMCLRRNALDGTYHRTTYDFKRNVTLKCSVTFYLLRSSTRILTFYAFDVITKLNNAKDICLLYKTFLSSTAQLKFVV